MAGDYSLLLTTDYSPLTTHCSLLTAHYSPLTTHRLLLTAHYSPLTTHRSLLTTTRAGTRRVAAQQRQHLLQKTLTLSNAHVVRPGLAPPLEPEAGAALLQAIPGLAGTG